MYKHKARVDNDAQSIGYDIEFEYDDETKDEEAAAAHFPNILCIIMYDLLDSEASLVSRLSSHRRIQFMWKYIFVGSTSFSRFRAKCKCVQRSGNDELLWVSLERVEYSIMHEE